MAKPATKAKRVEISVSDTQLDKVLASRVVAPSLRAQSMAIPLATIAFLLIGIVLGAMLWPIQRYETAPGTAELVGDLLFIADDEVAIYTPKTGVRFVTAMGSELTALQSFMGWVDPVVNVLTCEERFGDCDPAASRELQLGAMANAKEIAAYVALSYLGFDATFTEGQPRWRVLTRHCAPLTVRRNGLAKFCRSAMSLSQLILVMVRSPLTLSQN